MTQRTLFYYHLTKNLNLNKKKNLNLDLEENFGEFLEGSRRTEEVLKEPEEVVKK